MWNQCGVRGRAVDMAIYLLEYRSVDGHSAPRFSRAGGETHCYSETMPGANRAGIVALTACLGTFVTAPSAQLPTTVGRSGPVRLDERAFADNEGPWNPLGASLFWALWGERHDPGRLDRNLAYLAAHDVDFVRIFGMVGEDSWRDRAIDPRASDYWIVADRLITRLARHGLRAQITLFADAQVVMPDHSKRRDFAMAWARFADARRAHVLAIEVANEAWQNGFEDPRQLRELGQVIAEATGIPVALSAMPDGDWCRAYAGSPADFATIHYDRDVTGPGGVWRPVGRPWGYPTDYDATCRGQLPRAATSNEPIGPKSSVAEDRDPVRLALSYVTTFMAGNAAYVYHAGAGIRGGGAADLARGRSANLFDEEPASLDGLAAMRRLLPPGLANWGRYDNAGHALPWQGLDDRSAAEPDAVDRGDVLAAYASSSPRQFAATILDIRRPFEVRATRGMRMRVHHPATGKVLQSVLLMPGDVWRVRSDVRGLLVLGDWQ